MAKILILIAYAVYLAFCVRFFSRAILWYKAAKQQTVIPAGLQKTTFRMIVASAIDLIFFRRLFNTNKLLWLASWTFHLSFLLILVKHSWYFMNPVPDFIIFLEPVGFVGGHVLPFSLLIIIIIRISGKKNRYTSYYNFFLVGVLLVISLTGLMMRYFYRVDLIDVKDFIMGILIFKPEALPDSFLFITHFLFVLILIPYIPFHIFAVPVVAVDARRRQEELELILHEK